MDRVRVWTTPHGIVFRVFGLRINVSRSATAGMYRDIVWRVSWRPRRGTLRGFTFGITRPRPYVDPYTAHALRRPTCFACGAWAGTCGHTRAYETMFPSYGYDGPDTRDVDRSR